MRPHREHRHRGHRRQRQHKQPRLQARPDGETLQPQAHPQRRHGRGHDEAHTHEQQELARQPHRDAAGGSAQHLADADLPGSLHRHERRQPENAERVHQQRQQREKPHHRAGPFVTAELLVVIVLKQEILERVAGEERPERSLHLPHRRGTLSGLHLHGEHTPQVAAVRHEPEQVRLHRLLRRLLVMVPDHTHDGEDVAPVIHRLPHRVRRPGEAKPAGGCLVGDQGAGVGGELAGEPPPVRHPEAEQAQVVVIDPHNLVVLAPPRVLARPADRAGVPQDLAARHLGAHTCALNRRVAGQLLLERIHLGREVVAPHPRRRQHQDVPPVETEIPVLQKGHLVVHRQAGRGQHERGHKLEDHQRLAQRRAARPARLVPQHRRRLERGERQDRVDPRRDHPGGEQGRHQGPGGGVRPQPVPGRRARQFGE